MGFLPTRSKRKIRRQQVAAATDVTGPSVVIIHGMKRDMYLVRRDVEADFRKFMELEQYFNAWKYAH